MVILCIYLHGFTFSQEYEIAHREEINNADSLKDALDEILVDINDSPAITIQKLYLLIPVLVRENRLEEFTFSQMALGKAYYSLGIFDSSSFYFLKSPDLVKEHLGILHPRYVICLNNLGIYYHQIGNYEKALYYLTEAIRIHKLSIDRPENFNCDFFLNLALVYKMQGDYKESENLIRSIIFKKNKLAKKDLGSAYLSLSKLFLRTKKIDSAKLYNELAILTLKNEGDYYSKHRIIDAYLGQTLIFLEKNDLINAIKAYQIGYDLGKGFGRYKEFDFNSIHQKILLKEKNYHYAIIIGNRAIQNFIVEPSININPSIFAEAHLDLAQIYLDAGCFSEAFQTASKGMGYLLPDEITFQQITADEVTHPVDAVPLLKLMGQALNGRFEETENLKDLEDAFVAFQFATSMIPRIYREFQNEDSRLFMADQSVPTFEKAIEIALKLADRTGDDTWKEKAFLLSGQNKAALLYQALQDAEYQQSVGIPDSLRDKEYDLKVDIAFYQKKLFSETKKGDAADKTKLKRWKDKVFQLQQEQRNLRQVLDANYPEYFAMKYKTHHYTVREIQKNLGGKEGLIEYFMGAESLYAFVITRNDFWVKQLAKRDSLNQWVNSFREGLYYYWLSNDKTPGDFTLYNQKYADFGYRLYENLFEPLNTVGHFLPEKITIIPDDILGYIPFDALIYEKPAYPDRFGTHAYLMREYQFSYAYSTGLLFETEKLQPELKSGNARLLAIGPVFDQEAQTFASVESRRRDGFQPLFFNQREVKTIAEIFSGDMLLAENATKRNFISKAPDYKYLHLSTHAKVNDEDSRFSQIAFTEVKDTTDENDFLSVAEICNLKLNADMVVLSACETGVGELKRGEGIVSLARAFTYAGAKSIITTLWSVDDQATSVLMEKFYLHLGKGFAKDKALRQARLDYLEESDNRFSHPFFWAAAVPMGNMQPIESQWYMYWLISAFIFFLLGGLWGIRFWRRR